MNKFINEDKNKIIKISQVIKFAIVHSDKKSKKLYNKLKNIELFNGNKTIFEDNVLKPLTKEFKIKLI